MNPLIDGIKERLNNSFSGPLTLFFVIWNWQIFLYIFTGNDNAEMRISNIIQYIDCIGYLFLIGAPLLCTIIYILVMPPLTSFIEYWNNLIQMRKDFYMDKLNIFYNKSYKYKFKIAQELADKIHLRINSLEKDVSNKRDHINLAREYLNAIAENDSKTIEEHKRFLMDNSKW